MAGYTDSIEISYKRLSIHDLPTHLVIQKGSNLKSDIVNLLASNSQPLDHGMIALKVL
jgi:hypothetical protein